MEVFIMSKREALSVFGANGGLVQAKKVEEKTTSQKNYVLEKDVIDGIKALAKSYGVSESRMIEELYDRYMELLEKGKKSKKTTTTTTETKGK